MNWASKQGREMIWDVFCHVIDNWGDVGVCWRLAADLAARGHTVRLWVDEVTPLTWMAPQGTAGVTVRRWDENTQWPPPAEVVIEAFGCALPEAFLKGMHGGNRPPVWINLEYLSAEPYVQRCHGLPSPQLSGAGAGLRKWFYFPGFTAATGGLLRERDLLERQARFEASAWLHAQGLRWQGNERRVSLFCYDGAPVHELIDTLAQAPTLLLVTQGVAAQRVSQILGPDLQRGHLRAALLPALTQTDYDHLLWASDLNVVRGEDSFVRAQWAGRPFIWNIYPQLDEAHAHKLQAFCDLYLQGAQDALATSISTVMHRFNNLEPLALTLPPMAAWKKHCEHWRQTLLAQDDLVTQLLRQVHGWRS